MKHSISVNIQDEISLMVHCSTTINPTNSEGIITGTISKIRILNMWGRPISPPRRPRILIIALPKIVMRMLALTDPKFIRKILFTLQIENETELKQLIPLFTSPDFLLTRKTKNTISIVGTFPKGKLHDLPLSPQIKILKWVERNPEQATNILYNLVCSKGEDIKNALSIIEKITK